MVCLLAAPWVQLSISVGNGWPHNALRHHWLMPTSCHFRDCKALLVTSLTHVSGAITSVQTFTFTFTHLFTYWQDDRGQLPWVVEGVVDVASSQTWVKTDSVRWTRSTHHIRSVVNGDGGCRLWQPVQADSHPKLSGLVMGRRPLGAILHSSNEPGELSQWLCHDDSTINIVLDIIIKQSGPP